MDRPGSLPRRLRWAVVAVVAVTILVASVVEPPGSGRGTVLAFDALWHALGYAALALAVVFATAPEPLSLSRRALVAVTGAVAYGLAIEVIQAPIPSRSFALGDVLADCLGASAALAWLAIARRRARGGSALEEL